jgi:hypothetical protein
MGVGGGLMLGGCELRMEQISILSLTIDMGASLGLPWGVEGSSSLSPDMEEDEGEDPKESSDEEESGDDRRGVARIILHGDARISVGGRI